MKRSILFFLGIIPVLFANAQRFGGNPPSVKWKQINTDTARIIFPVGLDSEAQQVADVVHYLAQKKAVPLGNHLNKINIVLQNQTAVSNAYVGLAPFRSEFQMTPDRNNFELGSLPWAEQLAVHEYRHVMQYNNFRNGISKWMYYLFGESGLALGINASVPNWFYEGDAVYNETLLTNQGRGRLPLFMNAYPSLWVARKHYSYMKLRNGSFKNYVPDHYNLGYLLVNYGREKYGADFWSKVTHDASAFKGLFYPFQKAVKRYAGVNYRIFYNDAFGYYKNQMGTAGKENVETSLTTPTAHYVTNYLFPYQMNDDSLLYLKTSYRRLPAFIIKDKKGEHYLRVKDISIDDQFSYRDGKIVYAAYEPDARWAWKDYSVIKLLDIYNGKQITLTHRSKYFSPDISPDGKKIVAVQLTPDGKNALQLLNVDNGQVLKTIQSADIAVFTDPKFVDEQSLISPVRLKDGKMTMALINLQSGSIERLTPSSFNVLGFPCVAEGIVYFTASYSGNDDVFALRLKDRKVFQLTNDQFGDYYVNAKNGKIIASRFTADGYQLKEIKASGMEWKEVNALAMQEDISRYPVALANKYGDILQDKIKHGNFPESKYRAAKKFFNFHSWRPYYENPDFTFSLYGENILNTFQTQLYYHYNQDDKTNGVGFNAVYGAWFPYLNFGTEYTFDRALNVNGKNRQWSQLDNSIGLSVPLNFSKGRTYKFLTIGTNYVLRNEFIKPISRSDFSNTNFSYLYHYLSWQQYIQSSPQHIFPRLGYNIGLNQRYAINNYTGYQFLGRASLYLPGFFSTHSIVLSGAFQQRDTSSELFSNAFAGARGYDSYYLSRMWRASANYHFPIIYPDWGFGNLVYFQRIRGNVFYDFSRLYSNNKLRSVDLRSIGGEMYFDTRWWNEYPITFGIRLSHLLDNDIVGTIQKNVFEFILPVSIIPK